MYKHASVACSRNLVCKFFTRLLKHFLRVYSQKNYDMKNLVQKLRLNFQFSVLNDYYYEQTVYLLIILLIAIVVSYLYSKIDNRDIIISI